MVMILLVMLSVTKGAYNSETGIWSIGDLDSNEVVTLVIATKVTKNNGAVVNTVVVTSPTSDVDENGTVTPTVNKTNTTTPIPVVPLSNPKVTKVANQTKVIDDDTIKYIINITNDNTVDIDFVVNDSMDKGLIFISANTTGYVNTTIGDKVIITWNNFTVKAGETRSIEVIVRVDASDIALNNTVNVYNQEYAMNTSHASIVVSKLANITVSKTLNDTSIEKVNRGDIVVWKIVVRNNGPDVAENVTVTDVIGDGLTFVTATGDYTESDGIVTWFFNDLTKDGEIELYVTTRVISNEANIVNTLNVISPTPDLDDNGTVVPTVTKTITNGSITVDALIDPTVTKTIDTQDKYVKGDIVKYTIVVTNPNNITIVYHVVDTLPKGLVFVEEGSTEGANVDGQTISWDVEVAPNSDASIILMALIDITN
ncbi:unnamed protein product, partial [Cylicostephanus goldi]